MDKSGSLYEEFRSTKKVGLKLHVEELFSPTRLENIETHELVMEMGKKIAANKSFMREFRITKKATSKNFSATNGPYTWAHLDKGDHLNLLGTFATNDLAKAPFGRLTWQMDNYNRISDVNAAGVAQANMNGDLDRIELGEGHKDGTFRKMNVKMKQSLIATALKYAPCARKLEAQLLREQRDFKRNKIKAEQKIKTANATIEYTQALVYEEMYNSQAGWRSKSKINQEYKKLKSENVKKRQCTFKFKFE